MTAEVHLLAGLNGSGKTTHARRLEKTLPAVRFTLDEWMLRLHDMKFDDPLYPAASDNCRSLIWDLAAQVLHTGASVVLDWNLWSRERRAEAAARAYALGAPCHLHFVDVALETAIEQVRRRSDSHAHQLDADAVRHLSTIWEAPVESEPGFILQRVLPDRP